MARSENELRKENSEELPKISDESPTESISSPLNISLDIPYSSSSDSGESSVGDTNSVSEAAEVNESQQVPTKKRLFDERQGEYSKDDDTRPSKIAETDEYFDLIKDIRYEDADNEDRQSDNEYSEDEDEQLFDEDERISYKRFCRENIVCHCSAICSPRVLAGNPPSPFMARGEEVTENFKSLLDEFPGEQDDVAYLRLRKDVDEITIALSKEDIRELAVPRPFWASAQHIDSYLYCRLKLFPREIQERVNRCSAYMISLNLHDLNDWIDETPFYILEKALDSEMKEVDFNIIPLLYRDHWTLAIVCGLGPQRNLNLPGVPWITPCILHFNSLQGLGIGKSHKYAIARAVATKARTDVKYVAWHDIWSPQQPNALDCGFYVMRFAVEFLKNAHSPHPLPVHDFFQILDNSANGKIKAKFAPKARWQLRGFLGSVNRDERDWTTEFSEGKPCTIDILPYCIPFAIIAAETNEFKVDMFNKVRPVYVPSSYVIEHWKHIYDDFVERRDGRKDDPNERRDGAED